ncbi:hypothetical protein B2J88_41540 [Rhodococcus sp. SRB_17]|nr:hypothetical protein [Rhodococcus sp. SRB_17]
MAVHRINTDSTKRPTVVLLHSLGTDHTLWRHQVPALTPEYNVLTPDSRGHGRNPWPGSTTIEDWTADLRRVVEDHGPVHLVGLSMGGLQAIAFSANHPELVRSVVIANAFARLPVDVADARIQDSTTSITRDGMTDFAKRYLDQTLTRQLDGSDYAALFDSISSVHPDAYLDSAKATFRADVIPHLESITCPALVLVGEHDAKIPAERTAEIFEGLTDAALEVIPDAGHLSCIENPSHFNDQVVSFLNRVV